LKWTNQKFSWNYLIGAYYAPIGIFDQSKMSQQGPPPSQVYNPQQSQKRMVTFEEPQTKKSRPLYKGGVNTGYINYHDPPPTQPDPPKFKRTKKFLEERVDEQELLINDLRVEILDQRKKVDEMWETFAQLNK